jgi:N-acetylmuramoyl-L-alanine amidase
MSRKKIGVDGGHGKGTPGKRSPDGYKEIEFNHRTKLKLIEALKRCGFDVVDCSPGWEDNPLSERVKIANNSDVDIYISIHYNAMGDSWQKTAEGIEVYYHNGSKSGKRLAMLLLDRLLMGTKMNNRGAKSDFFLFSNGLYVLRKTYMPACLVECGFMDNKMDRALMESSSYQLECAEEIAQGCCDYFGMKYVPRDKPSKDKKWDDILKEVSPWSDTWIKFVKDHPEVNLKGLIEKLYYTRGAK